MNEAHVRVFKQARILHGAFVASMVVFGALALAVRLPMQGSGPNPMDPLMAYIAAGVTGLLLLAARFVPPLAAKGVFDAMAAPGTALPVPGDTPPAVRRWFKASIVRWALLEGAALPWLPTVLVTGEPRYALALAGLALVMLMTAPRRETVEALVTTPVPD